ncbi:MAG: hypothetical protein ACTSYM_01100 [Candidatus Baldrarchaeia archaeon]
MKTRKNRCNQERRKSEMEEGENAHTIRFQKKVKTTQPSRHRETKRSPKKVVPRKNSDLTNNIHTL